MAAVKKLEGLFLLIVWPGAATTLQAVPPSLL
jgi:hypothetical protein